MNKTLAAFVAVATIAGSLVSVAPAAKAENGQIAAAARPPSMLLPLRCMWKRRPAVGSVSATGMVTAGVCAAWKSAIDPTDRRGSCALI
jgi:hypothetical protein